MSNISARCGRKLTRSAYFIAFRPAASRHSTSSHPHQHGISTSPLLLHRHSKYYWTSSVVRTAPTPAHSAAIYTSVGSWSNYVQKFSTAAPASQPADDHVEADQRPIIKDNIDTQESSDYWGIAPKERRREDGSLWPWRSFSPSDTYSADVGIDVGRHYPSDRTVVDKLAYKTVWMLRKPVDFFFKDRHVSHALLLETVAAVPGMVGGMLLHLRSLRRFEHSGGWIRALLQEAENERMHLMTWVEVLRPAWWERALVLAIQGTFFNAYFLLYIASPRLAHRFVAYLEEEAVRSYSDFLESIDAGETPNGPAPLIAIDYWRLPMHATIRDVVLVVRADEAHHRDVNHFAADVYAEKQELRGAPAPLDYH